MNQQILSYKKRLDNLFKLSEKISDIEVQSHWARYLTVLVYGYIEISVRYTLMDYVEIHADELVNNYASNQINLFSSPKTNNVINILCLYSKSWGENLEQRINDEIKASVDSIVNNRHKIAHGENTGISLVTIKNYYKNAKKFIRVLTNICN